MKLEARKLLLDALEASKSIVERCEGKTFEDYAADRWFRRAVEREFEIIGEALNRLSRLDSEIAAQISQLRRMVDFRNRIIHGYDSVDDRIVWGVVEGNLGRLLGELNELMGNLNDGRDN